MRYAKEQKMGAKGQVWVKRTMLFRTKFFLK